MAVDQAKEINDTILLILAENEFKTFSFTSMINAVLEKTGYPPSMTTKIRVVCDALISGGAAGGKNGATIAYKKREESGGFDNGFKHDWKEDMGIKEEEKPKTFGSTFDTSNAYKQENERLKKEVEAYKLNVAELGKQMKTGQETYRLAEEVLLKQLAEAKNQPAKVVSVQLLKGEQEVKTYSGIFHAEFENVLQLAQARMNIFIYGPTGCGKSHLCGQVAEALDLPFYFVSCTAGMGEATLGGRLLPVGKGNSFQYVASEFIQAYENGGVFLLDEMDAADANVLLLINSALANGKVAVTNRPDKPYALRHPDFVCIAAANTVGTGADRMYSGRHKLDASTLDRFSIGKVYMDYDPRVEEQLCPDDVLRNILLNYRKKIDGARLERAMSTRFMRDAYKMKVEFGWTIDKINQSFFQGWREDEMGKVRSPFIK